MLALALALASFAGAQQSLPAFDQSIPSGLAFAKRAPAAAPLDPRLAQVLELLERDPDERETVAFLRTNGIAIAFGDTKESDVTGGYDPFTKSIKVSREMAALDPVFIAPTIVHEAQHARWHLSGYPFVVLDGKGKDLAPLEDEALAYLREAHFTQGIVGQIKAAVLAKHPWVAGVGGVDPHDLMEAVDPSNLLLNQEIYVRSRDQYLASRLKPYQNAFHITLDDAVQMARQRLSRMDAELAARHEGEDALTRARRWARGKALGRDPAADEKDELRGEILNSQLGLLKAKEYYQAELRKDDDWRRLNLGR